MEDKTSLILKQHGFELKKSMGQNFLFDNKILNKITDDAELSPADTVLEIGPGAGTLTRVLADRAKKVVAVEIDKQLIPVLNQTLAGKENIRIINADFLALNLQKLYETELCEPFAVVANLPYNAATQIIMRLLESPLPVQKITVLVQREVAKRMSARPGTPEYGALTCAVEYRAQVRMKTLIPPGAFFPRPKVISQVVTLLPRKRPAVEVSDEQLFFRVISAAFAMRRKTFVNNLIKSFSMDRLDAESVLDEAGLARDIRGERLSLAELARLTEVIKRKTNH
ncbi:MAG TPA: 16S rRNA (adenine(1518)-N(6)/adenine(1519)-N(6))-dimethyltransferase RsmA [Clostridia bacterium]|nr:16S rRNA (adenine(1518)-N(6)/adenine(1519)-N(6))-dimethyltransferase RsmA [Clostridia bacterium]